MRHCEVIETNRVDFVVELLRLGPGRCFGQFLEESVAKCDGRRGGFLRHHRQAALERAVLGAGSADAEVAGHQGGGVGEAILAAIDPEAPAVVDTWECLARVVGVFDDPVARNGTRLVDAANAKFSGRTGRANHFERSGARRVIDAAVEGVLLALVEQGRLGNGHLDLDFVSGRLRERSAGHEDQSGQDAGQEFFHIDLQRKVAGGDW